MTDDTLREECKQLVRSILRTVVFTDDQAQRPTAMVDLLEAFARSQQAKALREAAEVAKVYGVYRELNVYGGGPEWYRHSQNIAAALEAQATALENKEE